MCIALYRKCILHYQLTQQPDQEPTALLPKITCELVSIQPSCHSVPPPASWKCHWLTAIFRWPVSSIPDAARVRGWHCPPSTPPHTHAPLLLAQNTEKEAQATHLFQKCLAFHKEVLQLVNLKVSHKTNNMRSEKLLVKMGLDDFVDKWHKLH